MNTERFHVRYVAGPYSGTRTVWAEDDVQAIAKVRAQVRREMSLPMYAESYSIAAVNCPHGWSGGCSEDGREDL